MCQRRVCLLGAFRHELSSTPVRDERCLEPSSASTTATSATTFHASAAGVEGGEAAAGSSSTAGGGAFVWSAASIRAIAG